jgi:acid phosphatase
MRPTAKQSAKRINTWAAAALAALLLGLAQLTPAAECPAAPYADPADTGQPANLGQLKRQLINYKCFGDYARDVARALAAAKAYVEQRAGAVPRPALVLDIDETSLSNWEQMFANDFGYLAAGSCDLLPSGPCGAVAWDTSMRATAITPTLDLFNAAKAKGVAVFFITGRIEGIVERAATEGNLANAGYLRWNNLYMRPDQQYANVQAFKTAMRHDIEAAGYKIIANVGDQQSDLAGGYAERTFKVPNPFYYIP